MHALHALHVMACAILNFHTRKQCAADFRVQYKSIIERSTYEYVFLSLIHRVLPLFLPHCKTSDSSTLVLAQRNGAQVGLYFSA